MFDIKKRRLQLGLSVAQVAEAVGVAAPTVSRWESGNIQNMKRNHIQALAGVLHVSPLDILEIQDTEEDKPRFVKIPVFSSVSAGNGAFADGNIDSYIEIPQDVAKNGEYFGLIVSGDSMQPEIMDRDIIIVKRNTNPRDGQIVVAIINGDEGFCKRYTRFKNGIGLISSNPAYRSFIYTQKEIENLPVRIIGTVEQLIRKVY